MEEKSICGEPSRQVSSHSLPLKIFIGSPDMKLCCYSSKFLKFKTSSLIAYHHKPAFIHFLV